MARVLIEKLTFDDTSESRNKDKSKKNDHLHNISSEIVNSFSVFPFFFSSLFRPELTKRKRIEKIS